MAGVSPSSPGLLLLGRAFKLLVISFKDIDLLILSLSVFVTFGRSLLKGNVLIVCGCSSYSFL